MLPISTGGVFNYSAELIFSTGQRLHVQEEFFGHDVYDQLKMQGSIQGTAPSIAVGVSPVLEDLQQEFTHSSTGRCLVKMIRPVGVLKNK
jgi:G2F domain.